MMVAGIRLTTLTKVNNNNLTHILRVRTPKISDHTNYSLHQRHHRAETSQADTDEKQSTKESSTRNVVV